MKILYIACSCAPNRGSENRIGWMLPLTMARHHEVFVITREQYRREMEAYCADHPEVTVRFFYVPAADAVLRGPLCSLGLNRWHSRAVKLAGDLCRREGIRLIHQITPVEFRSIGDYGSIPGVTFLCGPVGGGEYIPRRLRPYMGWKLPAEGIRWGVNRMARRHLQKAGILKRCHGLLFANPETASWLAPILPEGLELEIYPEVGVDRNWNVEHLGSLPHQPASKDRGEGITFLTASRLIRRKGHSLLLDALSDLPGDLNWRLLIAGTGPEELRLKKQVSRLGLGDRIAFTGKLPFPQMEALYETADVLVLPSLRETTGSVVAEAMARGLPVILPDRFGGGQLVNGETGWFFDSRQELTAALRAAAENRQEVLCRGANAAKAMKNHTWEAKAAHYRHIYKTLLDRRDDHDGHHCGAHL